MTMRLLILLLTLAPFALSEQRVRYSYDSAGRLTSVDYGNGAVVRYEYDAAGNLLRRATDTSAVAQAQPAFRAREPANGAARGGRHAPSAMEGIGRRDIPARLSLKRHGVLPASVPAIAKRPSVSP
jgi:YD repeat-containing protein